ncbi:MAG: UDP-N-acetylglucosamine 1-carboxyvinyltransferase [Clostridiales bacterium]|nr:UDP-N-acetylglucosamine 1-carboxyvinyltransferase [Clostridiales bacterium]
MEELIVTGGKPLSGSVQVHGAKNSVLPILAATLLTGSVSVLHNCPALSDVAASLVILEHLGCRVTREGDCITVDAAAVTGTKIPDRLMREMRSSVIFLGAVLARCGEAEISLPGGCELGPRPIDLHLKALTAMGCEIREEGGTLRCSGALHGAEITLAIPSVGATENIMLAATAAEGVTVITNAAREPEIEDLQRFLRAVGADISGAGSSTVVIRGGKPLHGGEHTIIADRIVAATYLSACAAAGGEVQVQGVQRRQLLPVLETFREAGCLVHSWAEGAELACHEPLHSVRPVRTSPYPGFPTDAQPVVLAALCRGDGTAVFVETIFENRFRYAGELLRMGADVRVEGRVAVVCGVKRLYGAQLEAPDLRGGAALVVAALGAVGESHITGLEHIDRGYASLEADLTALGGAVTRREKRH